MSILSKLNSIGGGSAKTILQALNNISGNNEDDIEDAIGKGSGGGSAGPVRIRFATCFDEDGNYLGDDVSLRELDHLPETWTSKLYALEIRGDGLAPTDEITPSDLTAGKAFMIDYTSGATVGISHAARYLGVGPKNGPAPTGWNDTSGIIDVMLDNWCLSADTRASEDFFNPKPAIIPFDEGFDVWLVERAGE